MALTPNELTPYATGDEGRPLQMVLTSYSGCFGTFEVDAILRPRFRCRVPAPSIAQTNGSFNDVSPIRLAHVTDRLANTFFFTEKATATFGRLAAIDPALAAKSGWWPSGNWGDTLMTTFFPPNMPFKVAMGAGVAHTEAASSMHPGGLHVLMGDGSAHFLSDTIQTCPFDRLTGRPMGVVRSSEGWWINAPEPGVWQKLASRAGGEVVTTDAW